MALLIFGALLVGYALVQRRLERAWLTAPLVFTAAGWLFATLAQTDRLLGLETDAVHTMTEATLVLLLFHDASRLRRAEARAEWGLVARLLLVALPLVVLVGYGTASLLWPGLGVGLTLLIASALAPTDAGLGAPTVLNPVVPSRIRSLLNAESGLNDGLATPVVLVALTLATGTPVETGGVLAELAIGALVGVTVGWVGGRAVAWATTRRSITAVGRGIVMLALPTIAYVAATTLPGNGFIAAFVAGIGFAVGAGRLAHEEAPEMALETGIEILGASVWFLFGAAIGPIVTSGPGWRVAFFAVLSLTLLRMVPVVVALLGTGLRAATVGFVGWFGPRGLASLIFLLLSIEGLGVDGEIVDEGHAIAAATIGLTVLLSVVAHGLSGEPLARRYGAWVERARPAVESAREV